MYKYDTYIDKLKHCDSCGKKNKKFWRFFDGYRPGRPVKSVCRKCLKFEHHAKGYAQSIESLF